MNFLFNPELGYRCFSPRLIELSKDPEGTLTRFHLVDDIKARPTAICTLHLLGLQRLSRSKKITQQDFGLEFRVMTGIVFNG